MHVHAAEDFLLELQGSGRVFLYAASTASSHATPDADVDAGHSEHDGGDHGEHDAGS